MRTRATTAPRHLSRPAAAALRLASLAWPVFPLHTPTPDGCSCARPDCEKPGKHPRTRRGLHAASTSSAEVIAWWTRWPDANLAVATGALVVIDVDGPDGERALDQLQATHEPLPATLTAASARGRHLYYQAGPHHIGNSAGRLGPGIDVRGHGGYIIAPPSRHATGHQYGWTRRCPLALLPDWLAHLLAIPAPARPQSLARPAGGALTSVDRYLAGALRSELDRIAAAPVGARNDTLNRAAFRLAQLTAAGHGHPDQLHAPLLDAALAVGLTEPEAKATIASGLRAGTQHPRVSQ
jgi:hypothetical protein